MSLTAKPYASKVNSLAESRTMGLTFIDVIIANPANPRKARKLSLLVDSGAIYSVVSKEVLRQLGVKPHSTKTFTLADGSAISRKIGDAIFKLNGHQGASPVIFGEKGDSALLGTVSLEALGLLLDPIRRELRPLPMVLGSHNPHPSR
jgi:clan AA aspartic protease